MSADGERPRSTSGPSRSSTPADASALTITRNLLNATRPSACSPFPTGPSGTTGASSSGVAHAM